MADSAYNATALNGMTKTVYAKKDINLTIDEPSLIADSIPFAAAQMRPGNIFEQPVWLTQEHGHTAKEGAARDAHALNDAIASISLPSQVRGSEYTLRSVLSYGMISSMLSGRSGEDMKRAFGSLVQVARENQTRASRFVRDYQLLYGGLAGDSAAIGAGGLGVVESNPGGGGATRDVVITAATWAPALWSGSVGRRLDAVATAATTVLNTNTYVTVTGVNTATRTISLSGNGTDLDAWVATSRIFIRGFVGNEMAGMVRVALNTGTLNGISSTTYPEWTATTSTVTGALSFEKIMRSMIRSADFGNTGRTKFAVSNGAWMDVMTDLSALRQYADKAKGKLEQGGSDLTFYGPNGMVLEFTPSSMIKNGIAIGYIPEKCARIGTQDDQDSINGSEKTAIFFDLPGYNGAEMRRYWNQSFYTAEPTALVLISGITNKTV